MFSRIALRGLASMAACASLCTISNGLAKASTFADITPSLVPDRIHARAALTLSIRFGGGEAGVPAPLSRAVLRLPANLNLDIPQLRSCSLTRLQALGPAGCPPRSKIGGGDALVEGELSGVAVTENVKLTAFLGPLDNLQPTFEIVGEGYRPIGAQLALTADALPAAQPYGEELVMTVPPISTVPGEPDASVLSFSLTIGRPRAGHGAPAILVPAHCPRSGFPFAAEFTYADGSSGRALATSPCPK